LFGFQGPEKTIVRTKEATLQISDEKNMKHEILERNKVAVED
jgi:hypothetical protein